MAPSDAPTVPVDVLPSEEPDAHEEPDDKELLGTDKAMTLAERIGSIADLDKNMRRARPQILLLQRDSDAKKHVQESRVNALECFFQIEYRHKLDSRGSDQARSRFLGISCKSSVVYGRTNCFLRM